MPLKTPQFDKAIEEILKDLKPHKKVCDICNAEFSVVAEDIEFYKKFRVPAPKKCYECRRRNRLAFTNYTTLYKRRCDAPGHNEEIISGIPPAAPFPVYDLEYYWSDDWNVQDFNLSYDENKTFMEQFKELFLKVPQPALTRDPASVNSEYTLYGVKLKDCYYTFGGTDSENVDYSMWTLYSKDSADTLLEFSSQLIYEGVYPENCYNCNFIYFSRDCLDSDFLYDCRGCSDCFGCVNLRNKKYCIFNEQLTQEEYKKKRAEINLGNREILNEYKDKFWNLVKSKPIRSIRNEHSQNVTGNYIVNSKNIAHGFWILNSEDCRYTDFNLALRDSMDLTIGGMSERLYDSAAITAQCFNVKFSSNCRVIGDSEYLINCKNSTNCFGCIGLTNKKFCILNKQYGENDYWALLDKIKTKMLTRGAYGDFLPLEFSSFPYNNSFAQVIVPLEKQQALAIGAWWYDELEQISEIESVTIDNIPKDITEVSDDVLDKPILGKGINKSFKIINKELDFYKRKNLPIPSFHPYERMLARLAKVNNFRILDEKCAKCGQEIQSAYSAKEGYKPYCESCYSKEIV